MLYKINEELQRLLDGEIEEYIDTETGEVDVLGIQNRIKDLQLAQEDETEQLALYVKNLRAQSSQIEAEINALKTRNNSKKRRIESISRLLLQTLQTSGKRRYETARVALGLRESESVEITDIGKITTPYLRIDISADKSAIKQTIKNGQEVEGAALVKRQNLQIK